MKKLVEAEARPRRGRTRLTAPKLGEIDPTSHISVERQVYALLRRSIMAGVFLPGASLTGRSIAESLGVSASPVRDALKRLEADGVVEGKSKSAYYITQLSRQQYLEIMALRIQIERYAVAQATKFASAEDIDRIEALHGKYVASVDIAQGIAINHAFHFAIYELARSQILIDVVENLWMRIGPSMHLHLQGYAIADVTDNHASLIEALRRGNPQGAERALERDLTSATKAIAPFLPADANRTPPLSFEKSPSFASDAKASRSA